MHSYVCCKQLVSSQQVAELWLACTIRMSLLFVLKRDMQSLASKDVSLASQLAAIYNSVCLYMYYR